MKEEKEDWSIIIQPETSIFSINFKEIWQYRDLLYIFIRKELVSVYKQTLLGPLWFFIQPILTTIVFTVVFGNIAGISTDGKPKILFYLSGIVLWNYFADCLTSTANTFTANAAIFGKVYFIATLASLLLTGKIHCVRYAWIVHARVTYRWKNYIFCTCALRAGFEHVDAARALYNRGADDDAYQQVTPLCRPQI